MSRAGDDQPMHEGVLEIFACDESFAVRLQPGTSQRLGDGVWGARLIEALRALWDDYKYVEEHDYEWAGGRPRSAVEQAMLDGSLYARQQSAISDVEAALAGGVLANEPPMLFLAARCQEAVVPACWFPTIRFNAPEHLESPVGISAHESTRQLYLRACAHGSLHALLYVAWLLETGRKADLFPRDERVAGHFLELARSLGSPLETPLFPEIAFVEDRSMFIITEMIEFYEEGYGRPLGKYPQPNPNWHTWHDDLEGLDDELEFMLLPVDERTEFEAWYAEKGMRA